MSAGDADAKEPVHFCGEINAAFGSYNHTCILPLFGSFHDHHQQSRVYQSPWGAQARQAKSEGRPQYVTFEPDRGGFNNIR